MHFLSEYNVLKHKEFLKNLKLKYSVLEKSYPSVAGLSFNEIRTAHLASDAKAECLELRSKIILHELYFDSFSEEIFSSAAVRSFFGSEANFLYEIENEISKSADYGFLLVYVERKRRLNFTVGANLTDVLLNAEPLLALDLYEHAYFGDFGFDRKRYVKTSLSHLNLSKINDFYKRY